MLKPTGFAAPSQDGQVLVWPHRGELAAAVRENARMLRSAEAPLLDRPLHEWRRRTREAMTGADDRWLIVTGHQPSFLHAGVWAKNIVADRLAKATGGRAVQLNVDSDAVGDASLRLPCVIDNSVSVRSVRAFEAPAGRLHEQIAALTVEQIEQFAGALRIELGSRYDQTLLPLFIEGVRQARPASTWSDQQIAGRRAVESTFQLELMDRKVSQAWWTPLLVEMIEKADWFWHAYNRALQDYRTDRKLRGHGRPVPDLTRRSDALELPVWGHHQRSARRRIYVTNIHRTYALWADESEIGEFSATELRDWASHGGPIAELNGWQLRPRALVLTLWARLFLADLFIHGIGGAEYDGVTDRLIEDYFGLAPPQIACVSATLRLDLPRAGVTFEHLQELRHELRDMQYNPQRRIPADPSTAPLLAARTRAVLRSDRLRALRNGDHAARAEAYHEIRALNAEILERHSPLLVEKRKQWEQALDAWQRDRVADDREYFFALFDRPKLAGLIGALPAVSDFGV
jgi:hypothetical protein